MKLTKTVIAVVALGASALAHADGIEWSGFGSLYYAQDFDQNVKINNGAQNSKIDFTNQSLMGFNVGSRLSDDVTVASQIVAAGNNAQQYNFNLFAQWAYLNYKVMDGLNLKIGRQLWPVLISSEYQRVHQLLPQSDIPYTTYGLLPFVSFDGVSLNKNLDVGIGSLTIGAYAGNPKLNTTPPAALNLDFQRIYGGRLTLDGSGWRVHATYSRVFSKVAIDTIKYADATGTVSDTAARYVVRVTGKAVQNSEIISFGYRYDKHNFVSWGEMSHNKGKDENLLSLTLCNSSGAACSAYGTPKKLFDKSYGGYVLVGYRLGKFLPSFTYAQGTMYLGLPADTQNYEGRTTTYTLSTAYQVNDQATARIEYKKLFMPSAGGGWYDVVQTSGNKNRHGDAIKAGIDFIF